VAGGNVLEICPKTVTIRRTKMPNSDRLTIIPCNNIASIENIIINIDEPVTIRMLSFHVIGNRYCSDYKIATAEKRFCTDIKSRYVHFHISKKGYPPEKSEFLISFLPRNKTDSELYQLARELCDIVEWLEIRTKMNCIVFRYGLPVHWMDDPIPWQRKLEKILKETHADYIIDPIEGRIKHIREEKKCVNLTVYGANLFESINVS
jgi:hypothetical protein